MGYGIQGRGQALNLRDSGLKVIIAQRPGGPNYDKAIKDGFKPMSVEEATQKADVIIILTQDHLQSDRAVDKPSRCSEHFDGRFSS